MGDIYRDIGGTIHSRATFAPSERFVIRRILHIIFSMWLATLLLFGVTPKDALHAFADHCDTVHRQDMDGPVVEQQHHHCSFLSFQLMPFSAPMTLPFIRKASLPQPVAFLQLQDTRASQQVTALREGRGPPACLS